MSERDIPGKKQDPIMPLPLNEAGKYVYGTPTVPLKRHTRRILKGEDIDPKTSRAIVEFVEAAYWIESGVGDPSLHQQRAIKIAQRAGLSEDGILAVSQKADTIYRGYKNLAGITTDDVPLSHGLIAAIEAKKRESAEQDRKQTEKRAKLPGILRDRFQRLMTLTDDELRTMNSNERIVFLADSAYRENARGLQKQIERRALTENRYKGIARRQTEKAARRERDKDPFERVAHVFDLAKSSKPKDRRKLLSMLGDTDTMIQHAAAEALEQIGWQPTTPTEKAFYYVAKGDWDIALTMGEIAHPAFVHSMRSQDEETRYRALDALVYQDWDPQNAEPKARAPFYALRHEWSKLAALGDTAIPTLKQLLEQGNGEARHAAVTTLQKLDTVGALKVLARFIKDDDTLVAHSAQEATKRLSENPFYLQKLLSLSKGSLARMEIPLARALLAVNPEWVNRDIADEEVKQYARAIYYLPPVGGKIPVVLGRKDATLKEKLNPSMIIEEQIQLLAHLRQQGELGKGYIHQLTVQGRLPDEFKYTAIALILSSPYSTDWTKPFFEQRIWGAVAPLIHDGGYTKRDVNPLWQDVNGRTDFLQRIVLVHQPKLEHLESLTSEERSRYSVDELSDARTEQLERERLIIESKAYQRLALALHAKEGTTPERIPQNIRDNLTTIWQGFRQRMDALLGEYGISGVAEAIWFHDESRVLPGWERYGRRREADWGPIQEELIKMEAVRNDTELRSGVIRLLRSAATEVDRGIGLLPKTS